MPKTVAETSRPRQPNLHRTIFPVAVKWTRPIETSSDCELIAKGNDFLDYVVKDTLDGAAPLLPHTEWFCSELSRALDIPSPEPKVLEMPDGKLVFGSTWWDGPANLSGRGWWYERVADGEIDFNKISIMLSRIRAFDEFICNPDRHEENFLFPKLQEEFTCAGMDYSQAWILNGFPLPAVPLKPSCNTVKRLPEKLYATWKREYILDDVVLETTNAIKSIPVQKIKNILNHHPREWLPDTLRADILKWWGSADMRKRADAIPAGVKNGLHF